MEVGHGLHLPVAHVQGPRRMHVDHQGMDVLEVVARVSFVELMRCLAGGLCRGGHEGQFEDLDGREAAGGIAGQGPDDVDHPIADLIVERRGLAAQLHRGVDLDLDAPAGLRFDLARPGLDEILVGGRRGRQEMMQAQRHVLRLAWRGAQWREEQTGDET